MSGVRLGRQGPRGEGVRGHMGKAGTRCGGGGVGEGGGSQVEKAGARWGVRDQVGEWSQVGDRGQMGEAVI